MSASLRNAVKRRTHKERAQLSHRKSLGLLEKKKDYKIRADNYNRNKKRLKSLQIKAAFKNPEEFNRDMIKYSLNSDGQHILKRKDLDSITVKQHQVQNLAYLNMLRQQQRKKLEKLKQALHFLPTTSSSNKHVFFSDAKDEDSKTSRSTKIKPNSNTEDFEKRRKSYKELSDTIDRIKKLDTLISHIELRKQLSSKGAKVKTGEAEGDKPPQFQWKTERKR